MAGVLGCFAFGVGSTDMANAWFTKDIRIRVPETVRYVFKGAKRADVAAKDVMLYILASDYMKTSKGIGKVLEFAGDDLQNWPMDERATLTNMSVEAGGFTGIIEPDEQTLDYIVKMRGLDPDEVRKGFVYSDPDAEYAATFEIDLSCGACINAGPGASPSAETVTVSAQNRNFPGRSGPGKLYLASPYVVAASAIAGKIVEPDEFLP